MSTRCIVPRTAGEASIGTAEKPWGAVYTNNIDNIGRFVATAPTYYQHEQNITITNKTKVNIYPTWVNIGDIGYVLPTSMVIDINTNTAWDNSTYATASNRAGKDFYIYACTPVNDSSVPDIVISANSAIPIGRTSNTSRKIGGFHCLCSAIGTTANHNLSNVATGDIIANSVWDLMKRPATCSAEGMVYVPDFNKWYDIYLPSWNGTKLVSAYKGTIVDGTSTTTKAMHGEAFVEYFAQAGKKLLTRDEFKVVALGSNQGTSVYGSADPATTGGHQDTTGRRMVSNFGLEDCCGVAWQWTADLFETGDYKNNDTSTITSTYYDKAIVSDTNNENVKKELENYYFTSEPIYNAYIDGTRMSSDKTISNYGSSCGLLRRALVGGAWNSATNSGSRTIMTKYFGSAVNAMFSARGCADNIK